MRITTRILIPVAFLVGLLLVSQGTPETLGANLTVHTIEGKMQDIAVGPVAALESIKRLGTNGGGFFELTQLRHLKIPPLFPILQN